MLIPLARQINSVHWSFVCLFRIKVRNILLACYYFRHKLTCELASAGQLVVRHDGSTRTLDWGQEKPATIEWAAFYSDCEHEILEVTDGHRVTLTYNLYISNSVGRLISRNPTLDVKELPLFDSVKNLLRDKDFLPSGLLATRLICFVLHIFIILNLCSYSVGGVLGFCCAHQYAHTNSSSTIRIPHVLKGMDMALYAVFRALGLRLDVLPVLAQSLGYGIDLGGIDYTETQVVPWEFKESKERKRLETFRQMGYSLEWQEGLESKKRRIDELKLKYDDSASDPSLDFRKRLATLLYTRRIIGVESKVEEAIVGSTLWEQTITDEGGDETDDTDVSISFINLPRFWRKMNAGKD
jgi:hypothetical protein